MRYFATSLTVASDADSLLFSILSDPTQIRPLILIPQSGSGGTSVIGPGSGLDSAPLICKKVSKRWEFLER